MNWEAVGASGEVLGAILVAITLIYLIVQVRQNSASINATTNQSNLAGFNQINIVLAQDPKLAAIVLKGTEDPASLSEEENLSFTWVIRSYLNLYLNLYEQYLHGTCPEYLWMRHARELKTMTSTPGFIAVLEIDSSFQDLYNYIDTIDEIPGFRSSLRLKLKGPTHDA